MKAAIGVDVGTTGARAVAVDEDGSVVAAHTAAYVPLTPRPRWTEQDPRDWWRASCDVLAEVAGNCAAAGHEVVGIGLTGQMHGSVFLDADDEVIRPALLWNDQRTDEQCRAITDRVGADRLVGITGNPALTGFQAPKVLWLRDKEPASYDRVARVLLPKDYVRLRLTGAAATDAADASGTLFMDLRARAWSRELLDALDVPGGWFPAIHEGPDVAGTVTDDVARELGFASDVPVAAGGGDNAAAAIGTAITREGRMSSSIGSSGVLFAHAEGGPAIDPTGRLHAFAHSVPGAYCTLAVTLSAGASLRWWRDLTGLSYDDLVAEADLVPVGSEGLLFLPYLAGERTPHLDPLATGGFVGLTTRHTRGHLTRALMEGVVFGLRDGLDIMRGLGVHPTSVCAIGGGATSELWLRLQADIYDAPIERVAVEEGAAYGAALLGHVTAGTFDTVDEATSVVRVLPEVTEPDPTCASVYDDVYDVYRSLYGTLRDDMHRLSGLAVG